LTRKRQRHIATLVLYRHAIGKGPLPGDPTDVNPLLRVDPDTTFVKGLVTERLDHFLEFALRARPRTIRDNADDSWQFIFPLK